MSDLRRNTGGMPPEDGGSSRGGLPDLPPDWGAVVIPDNAAELDAEAYEVRRELRAQAWRNRLGPLVGLRPRGSDPASLGVPIVIMAAAVITTLLSLFVVTWDHRRNATAPAGPEAAAQQNAVPIADVTLIDAAGARVRLGNLLPAVVLLADGCDCAELILAIAAATPKPITVVPIGTTAACAVGAVKNVWCLADPDGVVIGRYPTAAQAAAATTPPPPTTASVADAAGTPTTTVSAVPVPMALAVPVDAHGTALEPILALAPADLADALATLAG